jgi:hypothetical protein
MKIMKILFLLVCACAFLSVQLYAQRQLSVINPGFEKPDSSVKIKGWDGKCSDAGYTGKRFDIPGWRTDAPDSADFDSGIEPATNMSGRYRGFMMGKDTSMYQICSRISEGDRFELSIDARNSYQANKIRMGMFYLLDDSTRVSIVAEDFDVTGTTATYSISFNASDVPASIEWKLGILFDNVSDNPSSWIQIDNVQLLNTDPTIIEVVNYSFELPDSVKIKGWNGPGSCKDAGWTGNKTDIPGWTTDTVKVSDSGIEAYKVAAQEGIYSAFLMGSDTAVWNTTDYTIQADDEITLRAAAKNSWHAELFHLELYYIDAGNRITLASSDEILNTDFTWAEYSIGFAANTTPACIGKKLGVLLDNVSPLGASWLDMDFIRINANHAVVGISNTDINPNVFSLEQNYPNPFNPTTKIYYTLKDNGKVRLSVYDIVGREVAVLTNDMQTAGLHEVTFKGDGLSSGMYFYKLEAGNGAITKKMVLLK